MLVQDEELFTLASRAILSTLNEKPSIFGAALLEQERELKRTSVAGDHIPVQLRKVRRRHHSTGRASIDDGPPVPSKPGLLKVLCKLYDLKLMNSSRSSKVELSGGNARRQTGSRASGGFKRRDHCEIAVVLSSTSLCIP